ncbi:MAG: CDP-diacylglycerol--glycerol-3-phosphate 3-phosphatidyltransferase [Chitinivibrionales bacterium]|nr:CDP-diacylglycerol--glycerol-3-phosphate 3-phosphatidyltransferase [Chitinivibrionales bacterium]
MVAMNPATMLTVSRLGIAPVFSFCFLAGFGPGKGPGWLWGAFLCLVLIEISDALDGYVARKRSEVTNFGKIFDPICDSLSRQTVFVTFAIAGIIPIWLFLLFLYRDGIMSFMRIMCAAEGTVVAARMTGKIKAVLQGICSFGVVGVALAHGYNIEAVPRTLWGQHPGFWIILPVAIFTVLSAIDYFVPAWPVLQRQMKPH